MERNWSDFTNLHSNLPGARDAFEKACETLFRSIYKGANVQQVAVKQGDGGIDIFVGNYGTEPLIIIQCKYFIDEIGNSQHSQINSSFKKAKDSTEYDVKEWILCVPRILNQDEHKWFGDWKQRKQLEYQLNDRFIQIKNGNELIDLMKQHDLYNSIFKLDESIMIKEIHQAMYPAKINQNRKAKQEHVLFIKYLKEYEPFYFRREQDDILNSALNVSHVWISGDSGLSKTNLLTRSVIVKEFESVSCDLSPITINAADDILEDIISTIRSKYSSLINNRIERNPNKIKELADLLDVLSNNYQNIALCIDELGIDHDDIFKDFVDQIVKFTNYHTNNSKNQSKIKFIISTITDPRSFCKNINKAREYFNFIHLVKWTDKEIEGLYLIIKSSLGLDFEKSDETQILSQSQGNPRLLKNIIKKIISFEGVPGWTIQKAINNAINDQV